MLVKNLYSFLHNPSLVQINSRKGGVFLSKLIGLQITSENITGGALTFSIICNHSLLICYKVTSARRQRSVFDALRVKLPPALSASVLVIRVSAS